jgi:putative FmdB family regulatory protein
MPIYEYGCLDCNGRFQKLVQGFSDPPGLVCPRCQGANIRRAISRFATLKSEEARLEAMADPSTFAGLDENDPRSIAEWAKRMGKELGDEAGEDWDEMVEEMLEEELGDKPEGGGAGSAPQDDLGWA